MTENPLIQAALLGLGVSTLAFTAWDLYWTTLGEGAGPLTRRLGTQLRRGVFTLYQWRSTSRMLSAGGVAIILLTVITWIGLLWLGWSFIFSAFPGAVQNPIAERDANLWERIYFTGYMISTLGIGDIQPRGGLWRIVTAGASLSGLFQITFCIAYLVPVALSATFKRKVAASISSIGKTADDVVINMWNGKDWRMLTAFLQSLTPELMMLNQQHLTYPVLHYFHSLRRPAAIGVSLAVLDETLSIVEHGLQEGRGPDPGAFHSARRAISDFLQTLDAAFEDMDADTPSVPTLDRLREAGVPVVSDAKFQERMRQHAERRERLHALLCNDSWRWQAVRAPTHNGKTGDAEEALAVVHEL